MQLEELDQLLNKLQDRTKIFISIVSFYQDSKGFGDDGLDHIIKKR